jgi:hypothetical protein
VSTGNKNTISVIVNYVVLGSIENFVIFILLYKSFRPLHQKMRQIDIFRKVIRHMLNSTVFPKPYTHTPTHTGISQRRAPQTTVATFSSPSPKHILKCGQFSTLCKIVKYRLFCTNGLYYLVLYMVDSTW